MSDHDNESATVKPKPSSGRGKFPARLHVLLARDAKVGLVIRRGPSKSVCTVLWNRERDTFKLGQWMRGRIYERRCEPKSWTLRKLAFAEIGAPPGRGCYWDAHELRHESTDTVLSFPEWEWADFVDGRLVWVVEGQLRATRLGRGNFLCEKVLHDFNDMKFESIAAPYQPQT